MRRPGMAGGVLVAIGLAAAGCFWPGVGTRTSLLETFPTPQVTTDGGLILTSRLLDGPADDPLLTAELWTASCKPIPHEQSVLLARNGFRVGILSGMLPSTFAEHLRSERSGLDARLQTVRPGQPKVVAVQGPLESSSFFVLTELTFEPVLAELIAVECGLAVIATPMEGGLVRLACEFQVQHGDRQPWLRPTSDGSGFIRQDRKALETYSSLGFTVILGPSDYLVIGSSVAPRGTLGEAFFLSSGPDQTRNRILIIQASRVDPLPAMPATTPARAVLQH